MKLKVYLNLILILLVINPVFGVRTKKMERKKFIVTGSIALGAITALIMGGKKIIKNDANRTLIDLHSAQILKLEQIEKVFFSESTKACVQAMQSIMLVSNTVAETELRLAIFKQMEKIQPQAPSQLTDYSKIKESLQIQGQPGQKLTKEAISAKFISQHVFKISEMINKIKLSVKEDTLTRQNICYDTSFSKNIKRNKEEAAAKIDKIAKDLEADFDMFEIFRDKEEYRQKWLNSAKISDRVTIQEAIARNDSNWRKANAVVLFLVHVVGPTGLEKDLLATLISAVDLVVAKKPSLKQFVAEVAKIVLEIEFHNVVHKVISTVTSKLGAFYNLIGPARFLFEYISQSHKVRKEEAELSSRLADAKILAANRFALKSFQTTALTFNIVVNSEFLRKINDSLKKHISASKYLPKPEGKIKALCASNALVCSRVVNASFAESLLYKNKKVYPRDIYPLFVDDDKLVDKNFFDFASNELAERHLLTFNYFFSLDSYRIFKIEVEEEHSVSTIEQHKNSFLLKIGDVQERKRIEKALLIEALRVEEITVFVFKLPEIEMEQYAPNSEEKRVDKPYNYGIRGKPQDYFEFKEVLREKACKLVSYKPLLFSDEETTNLVNINHEFSKTVKRQLETVTGYISDIMQVKTIESTVANYLDPHLIMRNKVPSRPTFSIKNKKVEVKFKFIDQKGDSGLLFRYTTGHKKCKYHRFLTKYPEKHYYNNVKKAREAASNKERELLEDFLTRVDPSYPVFYTEKWKFSINGMIDPKILELIQEKNHFRIRGSGNAKLDGCHYSFQFAEINFNEKNRVTFNFQANSFGFPNLVVTEAKQGEIAFKNKVYLLFYIFTDDIKPKEQIEASRILTNISKDMASRKWFGIPQKEKFKVKLFDRTMGIGFDQGHLHVQAFHQPIEEENEAVASNICSEE